MTSLTRWKLAAVLFAAVAGYALFLRSPSDDTPAAEAHATRAGALPAQLRRPLRISAEQAGISKTELVERLLSARSVKDVQILTDKLGMVGDDSSIRAVLPLLSDPRQGVPELVLGAIGRIGTEHAVEILVDKSRDDRMRVRDAAIVALGQTQSAEAESVLIAIAKNQADPNRRSAVAALGHLGTDEATETLIALSSEPDVTVAAPAVVALGAVDSPAADAVLRKLIDAPDNRIASAAIGALDTIDDALLPRLGKIASVGDPMLSSVALTAIGKAGETGLPVLREAALHGNLNMRWAAINAIGHVGGPVAIKTLGEILDTGDRQSAMAAASALASIGGAEARELLISSALSDRAQLTGALDELARFDGEDVDAALLKVVKEGSNAARRAALPRLLRIGNEDALRVAAEMATTGSRNDRIQAMNLLAESGTPKAWDALIDIAGKARGQVRVSALEMLAQHRPSDPSLEALLGDSLFSGRRDESQYAASVLGRIGTEQARQTLLAALTGNDKQLSTAAANALGQHAANDAVKAALLTAARDNPQIRSQVMNQLVALGAPEGLRLAEDMLGDTKHPGAANSALYALAQSGSADAKRLIERALTTGSFDVKVAAIRSIAQNPDDHTTDLLVRLTRDDNANVRAAALASLGQVGSEVAQRAILDAAHSSKSEDKIAALRGLMSMDDARASQEIAQLVRDSDPAVAQVAINSSYNGGTEVDQALVAVVNDARASEALRIAAANQLRGRGATLDDATEQAVTKMAGPPEAYGGYGYGGYVDI